MTKTWGTRAARRRRVVKPAHALMALVLAGSTTAIVVAGTAGTAEAVPQRVLQSVDVKVGEDGRVASITSRAVRASGDDDVKEDVQDLDAATLASRLPVRVQTAWRLGDRTGTDLDQIKGESGRVVIDLTVQNTTVQARQVAYDVAGVSRKRWALVGTPLTVVASADLGKKSYGQVVVDNDQRPGDVTNGVLGRGEDDAGQVQWATMLAPPRLGASATLRLVQDTKDFQPPRFDLSVQPGLVTDASLKGLLEAAFTDQSDSNVSLERRTISLITSVTTVLTEASAVLNRIQTELGGTAATLGARTIADLQSSSAEVSSSMTGLTADLNGLSSDISARLAKANDSALKALGRSVTQVTALLGDPKTQPPVIKETTSGCDVPALAEGRKPTIMAQIAAVSGQLTALSKSTGQCAELIQAGLSSTVGTIAPDGTCTPAGAAACMIQQVGTSLTTQVAAVVEFRDSFAARFDPALVGRVISTNDAVQKAVDSLYKLVNPLSSGGTSGISNDLSGVRDTLAKAKALLAPDGGSTLAQQLNGLNDELKPVRDTLVAANDKDASIKRLGAVRTYVCTNLPGNKADDISFDLLGVTCAEDLPPTYSSASLAGKFSSVSAAALKLNEVADGVDDVVASIGAVDSYVTDAIRQIDDITGDSGSTPALSNKLIGVYCTVAKLTQGSDTLPEKPCGTLPADTKAPLPELSQAIADLQKNQGDLTAASIRTAFDGATGVMQDAAAQAGVTAQQVSKAGSDAGGQAGGLVEELGKQLGDSGGKVLQEGRDTVTEQRARLASTSQRSGQELTSGVAATVRGIDTAVAASNRNVAASEQRLLGDLKKVLLDLGQRKNNGSGLLGSLFTSATSTGVSNDRIESATDTAADFSRVRGQGLDDLLLQQAQTALALQLQADFPVFGIDLPAGSTHTTVFSVQVGG